MRSRLAFTAAVLLLPACAPIVTHGPRVDPGLTGVLTLGVPRDLCDSSCAMDLIPQYGVGLRYGSPPRGHTPGYSFGATFSMGLISTEADAYLQAPLPSERWAAGAGVLAAQTHVMPYVQVGRSRADGSGWYTTQGVAVLHSRGEKLGLMLHQPSYDVRPVYWSPTLAYRVATRHGAVSLYVSGAFGSAERLAWDSLPGAPRFRMGSQPVRQVMVGLTFEERIPVPLFIGPRPRPGTP